MQSPVFSYVFFSAVTLFTFTNFVACGAKMYQVSLDDEQERTVIKRKTESGTSLRSSLVGVHASKGWMKLPIEYRFSKELSKQQREGLENAMKTWEAAVGRSLFSLVGDDPKIGDSFRDLYSSLNDSTNGHYIDDNWAKTGKSTQVLATTIWSNVAGDDEAIRSADIRFNGNYYVIGDSFLSKSTPEKEVVDMQSLALHELGHLIGLTHMSVEDDSLSIMNPTLFIGEGLANRRLSEGDIRRIQSVYGCQGQSCDLEKTLALVNTAASPQAPSH